MVTLRTRSHALCPSHCSFQRLDPETTKMSSYLKVQRKILGMLSSSPNAIYNLILAFPDGSLEAVANPTKGKWVFNKIFPLLLPHLNLESVLLCRQICSGWKQAVDSTLENVGLAEPDYANIDLRNDYIRDWRGHPFGIDQPWCKDPEDGLFANEPELLRFLQEMETHPGNPFPFRSVSLMDGPMPLPYEYWRNTERFLKRFGEHIWKLSVTCFTSHAEATLIIRNLLRHTPNVRILGLAFFPDDDDEEEEEEEELEASCEMLLEEIQFPPLPHLTFLLGDDLCKQFYSYGMPRYSEQLRQLRGADSNFLNALNTLEIGKFSNLRLLKIHVEMAVELRNLQELRSPLQRITVHTDKQIPLSVYLEVFHHFHQTLECIKIQRMILLHDQEYYHGANIPEDQVWNFPKLVTISLETDSKYPLQSFDVLKRIQPGPKTLDLKLKNLNDRRREYRDDEKPLSEEMDGEVIQVHGFLERLYESAIWGEIPRLETVKVVTKNFIDCLFRKEYTRREKMELAKK